MGSSSSIDHSREIEETKSKYGEPLPSMDILLEKYKLLGGCAISDGRKICLKDDFRRFMVCIPIEEIETVSHNMHPTSHDAYIQINDAKVFPMSHYLVDKGYEAIRDYLEKIKQNGKTHEPTLNDIKL